MKNSPDWYEMIGWPPYSPEASDEHPDWIDRLTNLPSAIWRWFSRKEPMKPPAPPTPARGQP